MSLPQFPSVGNMVHLGPFGQAQRINSGTRYFGNHYRQGGGAVMGQGNMNPISSGCLVIIENGSHNRW